MPAARRLDAERDTEQCEQYRGERDGELARHLGLGIVVGFALAACTHDGRVQSRVRHLVRLDVGDAERLLGTDAEVVSLEAGYVGRVVLRLVPEERAVVQPQRGRLGLGGGALWGMVG